MKISELLGKRVFPDVPMRLRDDRSYRFGRPMCRITGTTYVGRFYGTDSAGFAWLTRGNQLTTVRLSLVSRLNMIESGCMME